MLENAQWEKEPRLWNWKAVSNYWKIQLMGCFKVATSKVEWSFQLRITTLSKPLRSRWKSSSLWEERTFFV